MSDNFLHKLLNVYKKEFSKKRLTYSVSRLNDGLEKQKAQVCGLGFLRSSNKKECKWLPFILQKIFLFCNAKKGGLPCLV